MKAFFPQKYLHINTQTIPAGSLVKYLGSLVITNGIGQILEEVSGSLHLTKTGNHIIDQMVFTDYEFVLSY